MEGVTTRRTLMVVPFSVDAGLEHLADGIMSFSGTIAFEGGAIELRYKGQKLAQARKPSRITLTLDQLKRVAFEKRWMGSRLILEAGMIDAFEQIPFAEGATVILAIARKDHKAASDLMAVVQTRLDFPEYER